MGSACEVKMEEETPNWVFAVTLSLGLLLPLLLLFTVFLVVFFCLRKRKKHKEKEEPNRVNDQRGFLHNRYYAVCENCQ